MAWERGSPPYGGERPAAGDPHPRRAEIHRQAADNVSKGIIAQPAAPVNPADIEVVSIRPIAGGGTVKAFVVVRIGAITVRECKIVQQAGQSCWVAMPDRPWTGGDGKVRYTRLVELEKDLHEQVTATVLGAWERADG
jgi:DNA-binding cell septation regulator SpoVG